MLYSYKYGPNNKPGIASRALYYGGRTALTHGLYYGGKALYDYAHKPSAVKAKKQAVNMIKQGKARLKKSNSKAFPKKIKAQIRELKRMAESDMGTHIQRKRQTGVLTCSVNQSSHNQLDTSSITRLEEVLAQLRYYDPSTPTTLVNADGTAGTFQKEFYFKRVYGKLRLRNNYQVPVRVTVYSVSPKSDTSITATTAFTNGLTDIGGPSSTSTIIYLTDSIQFSDLYKINSSKSVFLNPGSEFSMTHSGKPFQYDPASADSHNLAYQTKYYAMSWVIRLEGVLGHDTSNSTEQTTLQGGVDYENFVTFEVRYSAGADIKYVYLDDVSDTFTTAGVLSNKPVADNQSYSTS